MQSPWRLVLPLVAALAALGGCIARRPLETGELDHYWTLHVSPWEQAEPMLLDLGPRALPSQWTLRRDASFLRSTISIIRAVDRIKAGAETIEFGISTEHAQMAGRMLAQARDAMLDLKEAAGDESHHTPERWAHAMAGALASGEHIVRLAVADDPDRPPDQQHEPIGLSVEPLLELAIGYLNEQAGGRLLAGLDETQVGRLREILAQMTLRLGFSAFGKEDSPGLLDEVVGIMRQSARVEMIEERLPGVLLAGLETAPPAPPGRRSGSSLRTVLEWAPHVLELLELVVAQWDRIDSVAFEFRQAGEGPLVNLTMNVTDGREVRIADLFIFQPAIVFRGQSRITVQPKSLETDEVVVHFQPVGDGATEVRFEGVGYGLVRLLALPLADAALREVRVATAGGYKGRKMVSVALLMAARGDKHDPRRIIAFQDVRDQRLVRGPFAIRSETAHKEQIFNYVTPDGRYTYRRVKNPAQD